MQIKKGLLKKVFVPKKTFLFAVLLFPIIVGLYFFQTKNSYTKVLGTSDLASARLQDYWNGTAEWKQYGKLVFKDTIPKGWNDGYMYGTHVVVSNGKWHLFSRKVQASNNPNCPGLVLSKQIRTSTDKGKTFSDAVDIVKATPNTPWECGVTDGSAFYNKAENKWYLLTQCIGKDKKWNGCLFTRNGDSPVGEFTPSQANPVIRGGQLWKTICDNAKDDCVKFSDGKAIVDEGTFDIFDYKYGYYYVSFHGYANPYGYRGIAKTRDFITWETSTRDLPNDAIFDLQDSSAWRENWQSNIGFGAARIIKEGTYYYALAESADINLGCTEGQNWDVGIFRTRSLRSTKWEQFPQLNPILYSSKPRDSAAKAKPCNLQYVGLIKDGGEIFMYLSRDEADWANRGIFFYKLTKTNNLVKNSDFWKCNSEGWNVTAKPGEATNFSVYRDRLKAYNTSCNLEVNCGKDQCSSDQSIYQDISIEGKNINSVTFGGAIGVDKGNNGKLNIVLWEIGEGVDPIAHEIKLSDLSSEYKKYELSTTLRSTTKQLRLQLYLLNGLSSVGSYKIGEAYVYAN